MTYRQWLSVVFVLLLVASVAMKLPGLVAIAEPDSSQVPNEIAAILNRHGFEVSKKIPDNDLNWVSGSAGNCHVLVGPVAPRGWHRSLIAQMAGDNRVRYVFEGTLYDEQPLTRTQAHYYWAKFNLYLGRNIDSSPVLVIIAAPACRNLPMNDFVELSTR